MCGGFIKQKRGKHMYERLLEKNIIPSMADLIAYCKDNKELFESVNEWLSQSYGTTKEIVFPYGNRYGWCIAHRRKNKLVCNIFAENNAFTIMLRLSDAQYQSVYVNVNIHTQECINNRYPCGDGGWIHYRVTSEEEYNDILMLLKMKLEH